MEASWVREEEAGAGCRILAFQGSSIKGLCPESLLACVGSHLPSVMGELWEGLLSWAPSSPSPTKHWFHYSARNLEQRSRRLTLSLRPVALGFWSLVCSRRPTAEVAPG